MQNVIIEKPYEFVPPHRGTFWSSVIQKFGLQLRHLRRKEGVESYEIRHAERIKQSLAAGHGILLTPNHVRTADPVVLGWLAQELGCHFYAMASWHLFNQGSFLRWAIRRMGAFSVNREGVDRQAITTATEILETGERPLIIFPEGTTTRTNDRLQALLDGVAFIARSAAKKRARAEPATKVVVHPIAIKYLFRGDLHAAVDPVLADIEHRLTWQPQRDVPLIQRIGKIGLGLLSLKELEHLGRTQTGSLSERLKSLIEEIMQPLEKEWLSAAQAGAIVPRVKALRMKILPEMVTGSIDAAERDRRWKQLANIYLAQQLACYPPDYLAQPTVTRILEMVERFEEDITDKCRVHGKLHAVIEVDEAIEVSPDRDRKAASDPLMVAIEQRLQTMLDRLSTESPVWKENGR